MKRIISLVFLIITVIACKTDNPNNKSYSLEQLEKNKQNNLGLASTEKPDLYAMNGQLSEMDRAAIEKFLQKKGLNIFEASYGLHFLGNRYFSENQFEKGMFYQQLAADEYLNPYAMLRLSLIYSKTKEEIQSDLPKGQAENFSQDYAKSFHYLHRAVNISILTMEHFQDRTVMDDINKFGNPLLDVFEKKDSILLKNYDVEALEKKAKESLPEIEKTFFVVYRPKNGQK
jgi:hypothetical protein